MNTDLLFAEFRSTVPMPDESTANRIYARATSGERSLVTRRRIAVAVLLAAGTAAAAAVAIGTENAVPNHKGGSRESRFNPGDTLSPGNAGIDWAHPGSPATQSVSSIAEAASELSFQPVAPADLGTPHAMTLDPETGNEPLTKADGQFTMAYENPAGGMFWLVERPSGATTAEDRKSVV